MNKMNLKYLNMIIKWCTDTRYLGTMVQLFMDQNLKFISKNWLKIIIGDVTQMIFNKISLTFFHNIQNIHNNGYF